MLSQQGGGYQSTGMREQYSKDPNFLPSGTAHYLGGDDSADGPIEDAQHSSNMVGARFDNPSQHDSTTALGPTQVSIVAHEPKKYYVSQKEKLAQQREQSQVIFFNLKVLGASRSQFTKYRFSVAPVFRFGAACCDPNFLKLVRVQQDPSIGARLPTRVF